MSYICQICLSESDNGESCCGEVMGVKCDDCGNPLSECICGK